MIVKEKASILEFGEIKSGVSKAGNQWQRMELVVETPTSFNTVRQLALNVTTERIQEVMRFKPKDQVVVGYSVSSRYWSDGKKPGRWFTEASLYSIESLAEAQARLAAQQAQQAQQAAPAPSPAPYPSAPAPVAPVAPAPAPYGQQAAPAPAAYDPDPYNTDTHTDDLPF